MSQKRQPPPEEERVAGSTSAGGGGAALPEEKRQRVPALRGSDIHGVFEDGRIEEAALCAGALANSLVVLILWLFYIYKKNGFLSNAFLACDIRERGKQINTSCSRDLQLCFMNKLSLPVFTGTRIEGEDSSSISIALVDDLTGETVISRPESSLKVEIVVLEGDFEGNEDSNWTAEEFKSNIVKEREGKRSLLTGDIFVELNEGIGVVGELSFTDNSSWTRSRKFKLGARVVDGSLNGTRVREAKTEAFMVKDHRGELYKKHYPPSLRDEVWRLEKIGKDGAFHRRLSSENINTVKDFLTLLVTDAPRLRNILGGGMSAKMWEVTVEHARTCTLTSQLHLYYVDGQRKAGVVFNVVGEVTGILSDQQFIPYDDLSDAQQVGFWPSQFGQASVDAKILVKQAYQNLSEVLTLDIGGIMGVSSQATQNTIPSDDIYSNSLSPLKTDGGFNFNYSPITSPDIFTKGFDSYFQQALGGFGSRYEPESQAIFHSCNPREVEKISSSHIMLEECRSQELFGEDNFDYYNSGLTLLSQADLGSAVASFITRSHWRPYAWWGTLIIVLKWKFSIKRKVATKKMIVQTSRFG
ncbi:hypothetical protein AXF42_Ash014847 [Apostasia shenzhenica]|uniref:Calmodulin-binding protein 60 A n=1 Tax=Apostasia shenzhenica TaxID=1088818 RepID=A0A2I0ALC5_9ASPA|nr:hypothetical protein AXF42_Ash014847 [Apostasia shenzhenica]